MVMWLVVVREQLERGQETEGHAQRDLLRKISEEEPTRAHAMPVLEIRTQLRHGVERLLHRLEAGEPEAHAAVELAQDARAMHPPVGEEIQDRLRVVLADHRLSKAKDDGLLRTGALQDHAGEMDAVHR